MPTSIDDAGMDIRDLIRHYRYLRTAAKETGVSRATLYAWQKHGIPMAAQIQIEMQTDGVLRADIAHSPSTEPTPRKRRSRAT